MGELINEEYENKVILELPRTNINQQHHVGIQIVKFEEPFQAINQEYSQ